MLSEPGVLALEHIVIIAQVKMFGNIISNLQHTSGNIGGTGQVLRTRKLQKSKIRRQRNYLQCDKNKKHTETPEKGNQIAHVQK